MNSTRGYCSIPATCPLSRLGFRKSLEIGLLVSQVIKMAWEYDPPHRYERNVIIEIKKDVKG
jgi:hypothetical protein